MIYFRTVKKNSEFSKKGGKSLQRKSIMSTRHITPVVILKAILYIYEGINLGEIVIDLLTYTVGIQSKDFFKLSPIICTHLAWLDS